jgi:hypothetical protein
MAERAEDALEHCQLMLVLLSRLPQFVDTHGVSFTFCSLNVFFSKNLKNILICVTEKISGYIANN